VLFGFDERDEAQVNSSFLSRTAAHRELKSAVCKIRALGFCVPKGCFVSSRSGFFAPGYMVVKTGLSRARKYPSVCREEIKPTPDLPNFRLFPHTHLCLRSYWVPGRGLYQSSLDTLVRTSISGPVRRTITYLSMDFGDFNFSSCEYHPYREQYPISVTLRVHS